MTAAALVALAERCEREEPIEAGPLDADIALAVRGSDTYPYPHYTTSLDAALTLVPDAWTAWEIRSFAIKTRFSADLSRLTECDASQEDWAHGGGATAALALCAAALRARASMVPA